MPISGPSIKTAFGGVPVYSGYTSGWRTTRPKAARSNWVKALDNLLALKPERVVPGPLPGALRSQAPSRSDLYP